MIVLAHLVAVKSNRKTIHQNVFSAKYLYNKNGQSKSIVKKLKFSFGQKGAKPN